MEPLRKSEAGGNGEEVDRGQSILRMGLHIETF